MATERTPPTTENRTPPTRKRQIFKDATDKGKGKPWKRRTILTFLVLVMVGASSHLIWFFRLALKSFSNPSSLLGEEEAFIVVEGFDGRINAKDVWRLSEGHPQQQQPQQQQQKQQKEPEKDTKQEEKLSLSNNSNPEEKSEEDWETIKQEYRKKMRIKRRQELAAAAKIYTYYDPNTLYLIPPYNPSNLYNATSLSCHTPNRNLTYPPSTLPLRLPLVNLGFPKVGSTSLYHYFTCANLRSKHFNCGRLTCGKCMRTAIESNNPPLRSCGRKDAYLQMDVTFPTRKECYWPQIQALEEIHADSPQATFLLPFRNIQAWIRSIQNWQAMAGRLRLCRDIFSYNGKSMESSLEAFFCEHVKRVREFVAKYPSHALVEFDIADEDLGERLGEWFGVKNESCWGHRNANTLLKDQDETNGS